MSELQLAAYLDVRDKRLNGRLMGDRIFRGTIISVNSSSGLSTTVTIQRVGDTVPDLTRYSCSIPGYAPAPGDVVDLIWRSLNEAIVLGVVSLTDSSGGPTVAKQQKVNLSVATGFIRFSLPAGFHQAQIIWARGVNDSGAVQPLNLTINEDSAAHYDWAETTCSSAGAVTGAGLAGATAIRVGVLGKAGDAGSSGVIWIFAYNDGSTSHTVSAHSYRKDTTLSGTLNNGGFYNVAAPLITAKLTSGAGNLSPLFEATLNLWP